MSQIVIICYCWAVLAEVPTEVSNHLKKYERLFRKWLKRDGSPNKFKTESRDIGLNFNEEDFIIFLNEKFPDKKSMIIDDEINYKDARYKDLPVIYF